MKPRDYCCCAIPVLNVGIYATLFEQLVLALLVGILAVSTPAVVGASIPSFAPWILFVLCMLVAAVQVFGFWGVYKERSIMFRRYTTIHILSTVAAFSVAAVWIVISFTRHNTATRDCEAEFFPPEGNTGQVDTESQGPILCNIFSWVTAGLMAALWAVLVVMQFYLYTVLSSYGTGQRRDHDKYNSIYSVTDIPLSANRGDPWDARASLDEERPLPPAGQYGHTRNESDSSVSTILAEKPQQNKEYGYSDVTYPPQRQPTYTQGAVSRRPTMDDPYVSQPSNAFTQAPAPTPQAYNYDYGAYPNNQANNNHGYTQGYSNAQYYDGGYAGGYAGGSGNGNVATPGRAQAHPAEGSFGRKTPRRQSSNYSQYHTRQPSYGGGAERRY